MTKQESLIKFPCNFPIKIIGKHTATFVSDVSIILRSHFPDLKDEAVQQQQSQQGNYISITATVYVLDQRALDGLYLKLTTHPDMKMVL